MRKLSMFLLLAGILPVSGVHADGSLQGLEMDVMEADESPSQATARIALPGASPMVKDGKADDADLVTGAQAGFNGGQAPALEDAAAMVPEAAVDSARDLGAETSDNLDSGAPDVAHGGSEIVDGGGFAEEPIEPGVVDGSSGDGGLSTVVPETSASSSPWKGRSTTYQSRNHRLMVSQSRYRSANCLVTTHRSTNPPEMGSRSTTSMATPRVVAESSATQVMVAVWTATLRAAAKSSRCRWKCPGTRARSRPVQRVPTDPSLYSTR